MTTGAKVATGVGIVAAISIIYFGFTDKGKAKWASLMAPKGTDPLAGKPNLTAEDATAVVRNGADGLNATGSLVPGKKDAWNTKLSDLKKQGLSYADGTNYTPRA